MPDEKPARNRPLPRHFSKALCFVGICAIVAVAVIVTKSAEPLWILLLLLFFIGTDWLD